MGESKAMNLQPPLPELKNLTIQFLYHLLKILMDYCGSGSVSDVLEYLDTPLTEPQIAAIAAGATHGLAYLHRNGIIHR
jgi:serine/threonine protein kinase